MVFMEADIKPSFLTKHPLLKDILSLVLFVGCVILGTLLLNAYVFRSYNVVGQSMENTLHNDDRIIVNRLPVTWAHFLGKEYVPERGDVIVFVNGDASGPLTCEAPAGQTDQYLIKRVIAFAGERVTVKNGVLKVYNEEWPDGYEIDEEWYATEVQDGKEVEIGPKKDVSGEVDTVVPEGEVFVAGDNREGSHSFDSRSGLGTIPYCRIIGPAAVRIYPFDAIRTF